MSQISNYGENAIINHLLRNTAITPPTLYLAIHDGDPGETGANEMSGGNYQRVLAGAFDTASARAITNTNAISLPVLLAAIGDIAYVSLWDALSGGNMWWYSSALSSSVTTAIGIIPSIPAGGLDISLGGEISTYAANAILDHIFGNDTMATPGTSLYVSLHTGDPGLTGASEVSGNGYARVQEDTWDSPSNGSTANTDALNFGTPTPSDWGTLTHKGVWDASSSGNFLISNNLDSSFATDTSSDVVCSAGDFAVVVA